VAFGDPRQFTLTADPTGPDSPSTLGGRLYLATRHEELTDRIPPQEVAELLGEVTVTEVRLTLTSGLTEASKTTLARQQARSRFIGYDRSHRAKGVTHGCG
jgi:hypothetical protein